MSPFNPSAELPVTTTNASASFPTLRSSTKARALPAKTWVCLPAFLSPHITVSQPCCRPVWTEQGCRDIPWHQLWRQSHHPLISQHCVQERPSVLSSTGCKLQHKLQALPKTGSLWDMHIHTQLLDTLENTTAPRCLRISE